MSFSESLFLVAVPGLEAPLAAEAAEAGFENVETLPGGVSVAGGLAEAARANRCLRCAVRVLWRVAVFRAMHMAQLDKRARKVDWGALLLPGVPVRVDAVCRKSRIYHKKGAAERVAGAIAACGLPVVADDTAEVSVKVRIEDDLCTISLDTTGAALHRRGLKQFVGKAPLRETMAAGFLRIMGFDGTQAVVDPMCGSGTIPLEAAEIAAGLLPGRARSFAFERLVGAPALAAPEPTMVPTPTGAGFFGFDRDDGAIRGARDTAARSDLAASVRFERQAISDLQPPDGPPGIVMTNPPYGGRIGDRKLLFGLYGALGAVLRERFGGWQVGLVTSDAGLARATGLDLTGFGPVDHSGTKVHLWQGRLP